MSVRKLDRATLPGTARRISGAVVTVIVVTGTGGLGLPAASGASGSSSRAPRARLDPRLPEGWTLTTEGASDILVWRAASTRMGDARVEFFVGDRPLGTPEPAADGRSYRLSIPTGSVADPAGLQVRAGGRRLDAAVVAQHCGSRPLRTGRRRPHHNFRQRRWIPVARVGTRQSLVNTL